MFRVEATRAEEYTRVDVIYQDDHVEVHFAPEEPEEVLNSVNGVFRTATADGRYEMTWNADQVTFVCEDFGNSKGSLTTRIKRKPDDHFEESLRKWKQLACGEPVTPEAIQKVWEDREGQRAVFGDRPQWENAIPLKKRNGQWKTAEEIIDKIGCPSHFFIKHDTLFYSLRHTVTPEDMKLVFNQFNLSPIYGEEEKWDQNRMIGVYQDGKFIRWKTAREIVDDMQIATFTPTHYWIRGDLLYFNHRES